MNDAPTDIALKDTTVTEAEAGAVVGRLDVTDEDGGALTWQVSDDRFEVDGDALRLRPGIALDHEAEPTIDVSLTATDADGQSVTRDFKVEVTDVFEAPPPFGISTGFRVDQYNKSRMVETSDGNWEPQTIDNHDWTAPPDQRTIAELVDYRPTYSSFQEGGSDQFLTRVTGRIEVDEAGSYDFSAFTQDTVRIYIDGVEVVRGEERSHRPSRDTGSIELDAGIHEIEIRHFDEKDRAELKIEMRGPGETEFRLVESVDDLSVDAGDSLPINIDVPEVNRMDGMSIHGLPHGTVIMDQGQALISDGTPLDLNGWDVDGLEIVPPSNFSGPMSLSFRANGIDTDGQRFDATETFEIDVRPDPSAPPAAMGDDDPSGDPSSSAGWAEGLDDPDAGSGSAAEEDDTSEPPTSSETGDEQMAAYDRYDV